MRCGECRYWGADMKDGEAPDNLYGKEAKPCARIPESGSKEWYFDKFGPSMAMVREIPCGDPIVTAADFFCAHFSMVQVND